ncbi:MAG: hypothetical protein ACOC0U_03445 [Desulfovibrionales bacterium]
MFQYLRILFLTVCLVGMAVSGWTWGNNEGAMEQEQAGEEGVSEGDEGVLEEEQTGEEGAFGEEEAEGVFEEEQAGEEELYEEQAGQEGLFDDTDRDNDNLIDENEFNETFGDYDLDQDFADFDQDGDGFLDEDEWNGFTGEYENEEWWEW